MASALNRTAIVFNLAAFVGISVLCISTQAPRMQGDILKRCQDTLLMHRIPIRGLSVDGRDVVLRGTPNSAITSDNTRLAIQAVLGVRSIRMEFISGTLDSGLDFPGTLDDRPALEPPPNRQQQEAQARIDRVLQDHELTFKTDSAVLALESQPALDQIVAILVQTPGLVCEIRGYARQPREARQKWLLALQRALATEDYLESKGIADWRLSARAREIGEGTAGRPTDRLVDFIVKAR
jgi:hypothetical protein